MQTRSFVAIAHLTMTVWLVEAASGAPTIQEPFFEVTSIATGLGRSQSAEGPGSGGFGTDLYVARADLQRIDIVEIATGTATPFSLFGSSLISPGISHGPWWPTFDRVGGYGGLLLVDSDTASSTDRIMEVDSGGIASELTSHSNPWDYDTLVFDPLGHFTGALFVTIGPTETLDTVSSSGVESIFATSVPDDMSQIVFASGDGFGTSMYLANRSDGKIYAIDSGHVPGTPMPSTPFASGLDIPSGLAISPGGAFGTDVMYVATEGDGKVLKLSTTGTVLGEFATGLSGVTSIYFTSDQRLILHEVISGDIWLVQPLSIPVLPMPAILLLAITIIGVMWWMTPGQRHS